MKIKINIFAPDPQDCSFRVNVTNEPDDELRLRDQLYALAPNAEVIAVEPSHQGSFDVTVDGNGTDIATLIREYNLVNEDIIYL